eukprot:s2263_g5.t1
MIGRAVHLMLAWNDFSFDLKFGSSPFFVPPSCPYSSSFMTLVIAPPALQSLQQLFQPILHADRQLQDLYHCLHTLIEVEDFLEDQTAPAALFSVRQTIRMLRRAIADVAIFRLHQYAVLQRHLRQHWLHFRQVPPLDLEL